MLLQRVWLCYAATGSCRRVGEAEMPKRLNSTLAGTGSLLTAEHHVPSSPRAEMMPLFHGTAFSAVFESSGEALIVVDSLGAVHQANRRSQQMLRLRGGHERRENLAEFISAAAGGDLRSWWKTAAGWG